MRLLQFADNTTLIRKDIDSGEANLKILYQFGNIRLSLFSTGSLIHFNYRYNVCILFPEITVNLIVPINAVCSQVIGFSAPVFFRRPSRTLESTLADKTKELLEESRKLLLDFTMERVSLGVHSRGQGDSFVIQFLKKAVVLYCYLITFTD